MTFHKSNRAEYVRSGCKLCEKMLQTLAEYFKIIYDAQLNNGDYQCHQLDKAQADAKHEMCTELQEHYACKLRHFADHHRSDRLHSVRRDDNNGYC